MTLNQVILESSCCHSNCYLQVLFNPDIADYQTFQHGGFYVNFQGSIDGYFTVDNFFHKLSKKELAEATYEFLSYYDLRRDIFLKKYSKWVL